MPDIDPRLIDRIVRDVLATWPDGPASVAATRRAADAAPAVGDSKHGALLLDEPVLTEASLESRVNGHGAIVIGTKTVLTPTARDFLRTRNIGVSRVGEAESDAASATAGDSARWLALVVEEHAAARRAAEDVARERWRHGTIGCWRAATERAVTLLGNREIDGVALVTTHTAAVGCRANRQSHVRAAVVDDVHGVKAARATIGTNLIIVDPTEQTFVGLRNVLREFAAGGVPAPPAGWED